MASSADLARLRGEVGAVVARHEARGRRVNLAKYADDFPGFCRDVLGVELWDAQRTMGASVLVHPRTVVVSGHSTGKDFFAAAFCLFWVYVKRGQCLVTGPTERQVRGIVFQHLRHLWTATDALPGELYTQQLVVDGVPVIVGFTSDNSSRLTGWHHERLLVVMSEAQGCAPESWEAMLSCATSPDNRVLCYGQPIAPTGSFYNAAHSSQWHCLTVSCLEHPNITHDRMVVPGGPSREWVAYMRAEYGETSSVFLARVLAIFPDESIEGLVKRAWVDMAVARWRSARERPTVATPADEEAHARWRSDREVAGLAPLTFGLDVARFGADSTVLAVLQGGNVLELISWRDASLPATADRVQAEAQRFGARYPRTPKPPVWVDVIGLGAGAFDTLRERGYPAHEFNGSEKATDPSRFLNRRAEAFWFLRTALEAETVTLPPDPELVEELMAVEWTINPARGAIQIVAKDELRKTLGRSPDRLDSVVIGVAAALGGLRPPTVSFETFSYG